jgi:uridine phosphorylase
MTSHLMDAPDSDQPLLTAADMLAHRRARGAAPASPPPEAVILNYQRHLLEYARRRHPVKKVNGFYGDLYLLKRTGGRVAVAGGFGIGAPVTAVLVEDLAAFGVRRFVALGLAGGLQSDLRSGDLVLCERAIRDEGVSRNYLPPAQFVEAAPEILRGVGQRLTARGQSFAIGTSWTTDTPYRELRREVEQHQRDGVKTVEMEAAALFAVGQALHVSTGAAFAVADTLAGLRWRLEADLRAAHRGLEILFEAALEYLGAS